VEKIVNKLSHLHETDPAAYQSFMKEQAKEFLQYMTSTDSSKNRILVPDKDFVVKTSSKEHHVFINFCKHENISFPKDQNGNKLELDTDYTNSEIPLIVSKCRQCLDSRGLRKIGLAVDVVFHPYCLQRSKVNESFKAELIHLGIKAVQEDLKITLGCHWKIIKSLYKGGTGLEGVDVVPLPVGNHPHQNRDHGQRNDAKAMRKLMENPLMLLHSIRTTHIDENSNHNITISNISDISSGSTSSIEPVQIIKTVSDTTRFKNYPLIQEIEATSHNSSRHQEEKQDKIDKDDHLPLGLVPSYCPQSTPLLKELKSRRRTKSLNTNSTTKTGHHNEVSNPVSEKMKGFLITKNEIRALYEEDPSCIDGKDEEIRISSISTSVNEESLQKSSKSQNEMMLNARRVSSCQLRSTKDDQCEKICLNNIYHNKDPINHICDHSSADDTKD
jgi:hypothetical protein